MGLIDFLTNTDTLTIIECGVCHIKHAIPTSMQRSRKEDGKTWYCPNGHQIGYTNSENDKLKKEQEKLKQELEHAKENNDWYSKRVGSLHTELTKQKHSNRALKAAKTKIMNRVKNGVCPCCRRNFSDLHEHFKTVHPELFEKKNEG